MGGGLGGFGGWFGTRLVDTGVGDSYLVTVEAAHAGLDLCGLDVADPGSQGGFDEDACEQADETGRVQQGVAVGAWNAVVNARCQVVSPGAICSAKMLLAVCILLLALEETLFAVCQPCGSRKTRVGALTCGELLVIEIDELLQTKHQNFRGLLSLKQFPEEV